MSSSLFSVHSLPAAPEHKPCKDGEFQCGSSEQCIEENKVCDAHSDCRNGEDEVMQCGELLVMKIYPKATIVSNILFSSEACMCLD